MNTLNAFWNGLTFGAFERRPRTFSAGMLNTGELIVVDQGGHVQIFAQAEAQTIKQVLS